MNEGGPRELILPDKTGFISRTEDEFIRNTEKFFLDASLIKSMGKNAVEHVSNRFTEERIFSLFWKQINKPITKNHDSSKFQFDHPALDPVNK